MGCCLAGWCGGLARGAVVGAHGDGTDGVHNGPALCAPGIWIRPQVWDCVAQRIPQRARWIEECAAALEAAEEHRREVRGQG